MFKPCLHALLPVLLPALSNIAVAQQLPALKTPQDIDAFFQTYYQRPRPELIASAIDGLHSTGML